MNHLGQRMTTGPEGIVKGIASANVKNRWPAYKMLYNIFSISPHKVKKEKPTAIVA